MNTVYLAIIATGYHSPNIYLALIQTISPNLPVSYMVFNCCLHIYILLRSTDGKFKVLNKKFADLVVKFDDIKMNNNPAYQCDSKQDDVKDHQYEIITIDDKVVKPVPNNNTVSN